MAVDGEYNQCRGCGLLFPATIVADRDICADCKDARNEMLADHANFRNETSLEHEPTENYYSPDIAVGIDVRRR